MSSLARDVAIGLAEKLGGPMEVMGPLLRECSEEELTAYVSQMFEAARRGKWDAFLPRKNETATSDDDDFDGDVAGFLAAHCPLLEGTHLGVEDQTWSIWLMQTSNLLMEQGESFQSSMLEKRWDKELSSAFRKFGIDLSYDVLNEVADKIDRDKKGAPRGVKWYLKRKLSEEDDTSEPVAFLHIYANLGRMLEDKKRYDARYLMRDLYGVRGRYHDDKCTFAEFNAWFWDRHRARPYPVPSCGRDTDDLLADLVTWSDFVSPKHKEAVSAFCGGMVHGELDVAIVRKMRKASESISRSILVPNPDPATKYRRPHLYVCRIHTLLDNIEHLSRTDTSL